MSAVFIGACAIFLPGIPFAAMIAILLVGGFFRSLQFTSINTIAYAEVEQRLMSRATSMVAAASNCRCRPASRSARWWSNRPCG